VTDADASDETLLAALDEALAEQADPRRPVPEGTQLIDSGVLATCSRTPLQGREARDEQNQHAAATASSTTRCTEGRIAPAAREHWRAQLDSDEDGTTAARSLAANNAVPVTSSAPAGRGQGDDAEYYACSRTSARREGGLIMAEYLPLHTPGQGVHPPGLGGDHRGQLVRVSGSGTVAPVSAASPTGSASPATTPRRRQRDRLQRGRPALVASGAITAGANVEGAAAGKVAAHTNGTNDFNIVGLALTTVTVGQLVEVSFLR
jgi:hypothetical protein